MEELKKTPVDMLLSYQTPHLLQIFEAISLTQCVLDGSDTGCGKTYVTIALCYMLGLKPFIICPKSVLSTWKNVSKLMGVEILGLSNYEKLKGGKYYTPNLEVVECPYLDKLIAGEDEIKKSKKVKDGLPDTTTPNTISNKTPNKTKKDYVFQFPIDTIIVVDEAHKCKNSKSGNSKMLLSLKDSGRKIVLLSATLTDKIECFKPFGVMFGLYDDTKKFKLWIRHKLSPKKNMKKLIEKKNNIHTLHDKNPKNPKNPKDPKDPKDQQKPSDDEEILKIIHNSVFPSHGSRMKIKELGPLFPQNQVIAGCYYSEDHCEVDKIYDLINKALADIKIKETRSEGLGEIVRCRMRLEMLKLPIILDIIDEGLESGRSVAIFVNFKDSMMYLQHHLKEECSLIHGDQSIDERSFNIDQFQTNKVKIIIAIIQAGGVGISLHDLYGRPRMSIISPSWNGIDVVQCLGRIHRAGSKSAALQRIVYIAESYEEKICSLLQSKIAVMSKINDGDLVGEKLAKEHLKEIGELNMVNENVTNLSDVFVDVANDNVLKKPAVNENESEDEKLVKIKKNPEQVKRKKFKVVEEENKSKEDDLKQKLSYLERCDTKLPGGGLNKKYKVKK